MDKEAPARDRVLTKMEYVKLLDACTKSNLPPLLDAVKFAYLTGARQGEQLRLKLEHVDFERRVCTFYDTKNGEDRYIPLTRHAQSVLKTLSKVYNYVFPITADCLKSAWNRIKTKSGIKDLRFHDLRHESVSRFFEMGLSIPEVALISGHKDVRQLFRYTHLKAENLREKYKEVF